MSTDETEAQRGADASQEVASRDGAVATQERHEESAEASPEEGQPDVLLDVPVLNVDELSLEVDALRAHVSLQTEVVGLLKIDIGADVALEKVALEIKGVEAQALLKARLDNVAGIVDRVLTTVDNNPEALDRAMPSAEHAVGEVAGGGKEAIEDVGEGAGQEAEGAGEGAGRAAEDVGRGAGQTVEDAPGSAEQTADQASETAGEASSASGGRGGARRGQRSRPTGRGQPERRRPRAS